MTDIAEYKRQIAQRLSPDERKRLEALESAALTNLTDGQIEKIKRDPSLGSYPTARLIIAAFRRQEAAISRDYAEKKSEVERESRRRL